MWTVVKLQKKQRSLTDHPENTMAVFYPNNIMPCKGSRNERGVSDFSGPSMGEGDVVKGDVTLERAWPSLENKV